MVKKDKKTIQDLKRRLLDAIRVLSAEGVLDGSGHLSAKIPGTETFIIIRVTPVCSPNPAICASSIFPPSALAEKSPSR
jgi:hypothetical protein